MTRIRILRVASSDLEEAVDYYNGQSPGRGYALADEFMRAQEMIAEYPEAWSPFSDRCRRYRLSRFPYGVLYSIQGDLILIAGVMHLASDPLPWIERLAQRFPR